jgi:ABC-type glycerol-3-phosphate transport system permease component
MLTDQESLLPLPVTCILSSIPRFAPLAMLLSSVIVVRPIIMVYPFIQKFFAKGVMIGSLKE